MSDPKRGTLITVGAPKSVKNNVNKTVRLTINLDESNESKYPELNYKELVIAAARKKRAENGKTSGLDPFSDNDDDVERVARKFEQKYGGKSTYGRKGRSKYEEFADIGAGYDENDSFIDNTHGYDEMIPPECDTLYGGFYINCGSLEFKTVPENQSAISDAEPNRRNKRRISSSSSEDESSDSSSESDSQEAKDKVIANGAVDGHETEHRKKKNKDVDKKKAKKIRRTDSSAATSGKQTSDDNVQADGESVDSRTSQSDSLTSKPAPSSENPITSDSSRDTDAKMEVKLPAAITQLLEQFQAISRQIREGSRPDGAARTVQCVLRLKHVLAKMSVDKVSRRIAWKKAAKLLNLSRAEVQEILKDVPTTSSATIPITANSTTTTANSIATNTANCNAANSTSANSTSAVAANIGSSKSGNMVNSSIITSGISAAAQIQPTNANTTTTTVATATATATSRTAATTNNKRKHGDDLQNLDVELMSPEQKEEKIVQTLKRLKELIEERKPAMMATYNAECERVQEERKKLLIGQAGASSVERRLPKRRFPWCGRSRALLAGLARLAAGPAAAAALLHARALPLFPPGFVRMPTLLRQADLNKEVKAADLKRQRIGSTSQTAALSQANPQQYGEPIQFPSSLTVTTSAKPSEKSKEEKVAKHDGNMSNMFGTVMNSYSISKDKPDDRKREVTEKKDDLYIPPNNIGCITITPVNCQKSEKKVNVTVSDKAKESLIRVKSPADLNEMVNKKEKDKQKRSDKSNNSNPKEKRIDSPLHIDTGVQNKKDLVSPKTRDEVSQKQIETMRVAENNIPRPALVAKHSPTFAKPDKRPPEVKKKKEVLIVSDVDPLGDIAAQEPVAIDDSSSDVEVVEERPNKSEPKSENKSDTVPLKDKVSDTQKKVNNVKSKVSKECRVEGKEAKDFIALMKDIREMKHSQEPDKLNCNSYGGVITSAKSQSSKPLSRPIFGETRSDKDKLAERTSLKKMDGCSAITG